MRLILVFLLLSCAALAQEAFPEPQLPIYNQTPRLYQWVPIDGLTVVRQADGTVTARVNAPADNAAALRLTSLESTVADLHTTIASLQNVISQLRKEVADLESRALPPPPAPIAQQKTVTGDGSSIELASTPADGSLIVFRNGLAQWQGDDWTLAGSNVTLAKARSGDRVIVQYQSSR